MKAGIIAGMAALALAACGAGGPSDREVLVNSCTSEGEAEATCGCIADALENNLTPELFSRTANAVGRESKDMMTFVAELTVQEQLAFSAVLDDMFACSLTGEKAE